MAHSALQNSLAVLFRAAIGADRVIDDEGARQHAASDIAFEATCLPACVLAPRSESEVIALVNAARAEGVALHPRGGGWSYTAGYAPQVERSAMVDMRGFGGIALDRASATVEVGAGVTWSELDDVLKAQNLRVPSFGPLSGIGAQIGATAAQNGGFFGGASHGAVSETSLATVSMIDGRAGRYRLTARVIVTIRCWRHNRWPVTAEPSASRRP